MQENHQSLSTSVLPKLRELIRNADDDELAVDEIRAIGHEHPELSEVANDLEQRTRKAWLDLLAGNDDSLRTSIERRLADMRAEFAGVEPTFLERLLIERVLSSWLAVQCAEAQYIQILGQPCRKVRDALKHLQAANRHLQASIRQLVLLRKLLPSMPERGAPDPLMLIGIASRRERLGGRVLKNNDDDSV